MNATFKQRTALFNMYSALGRSTKGIRDLTVEQASEAIKNTLKIIKENGFPKDTVNGIPEGDSWG